MEKGICKVEGCGREAEKFNDEDGDFYSSQCTYHNDKDIERSQEAREWAHYH